MTFLSYLAIELKDGYHARFGFSWEDMAANLAGNVLATVFELSPTLDRMFDVRLLYQPSPAYVQAIAADNNVGQDYSGMRFELLLKAAAFVPPSDSMHSALDGLRYVAIVVGFDTRGYKPVREAVATRSGRGDNRQRHHVEVGAHGEVVRQRQRERYNGADA